MWVWNGMPNDARPVSGWLFSRGYAYALSDNGDHFGIGGVSGQTGRLIFFHGKDPANAVGGRTEVPRWQWQHVTFARDGENVRGYLNGHLEFETKAPLGALSEVPQCFFGGRSDNDSNWEGRLDEIAVFDRALTAEEIVTLAK
jgi:hypothetical protein